MPVKNPPHPGEIIRDLYIEPLALTITAAAAGLASRAKPFNADQWSCKYLARDGISVVEGVWT